MNTTQALLERIAALRQRLAVEDNGLPDPAGPRRASTSRSGPSRSDARPQHGPAGVADSLDQLERQVAAGSWHNNLIDGSVREVVGRAAKEAVAKTPIAPAKLSARGLRLLQRGRDLLREFRQLADEPMLLDPRSDSLAGLYQETAAMLDMGLRAAQSFPPAPSAQARWCDGLEATLSVVGDRLSLLLSGIDWRRRNHDLVDTLADLLDELARGGAPYFQSFVPLAQRLVDEARQGLPLRWHQRDPAQPALFVAAHSLVAAQVMARLTLHDSEWGPRPDEPVLAALLHDVGMLRVPAGLLALAAPLNDEQRRQVEYHPIVGAELLSRLAPGKSWLMEAAVAHHERIDGTGYPAGLRDLHIPPLVRLLTVCDIYAALCCPRPYRPALDTRTALTDTLLLADQGGLDRSEAEKLLELSFFPVGSVVELADGAVGIVVAVHSAKKNLHLTSRPTLAMLTNPKGEPLPYPQHLDLASYADGKADSRSILRSLPAGERRELLMARYPEL